MFENLTNRLTNVLDGLRGRGRLTDADLETALRGIRMALLEADVALPVVKGFIARVRERATGADIAKSLTPGQAVVGIVHRELVASLGDAVRFEVRAKPPAVVLLAGLQGAGKTTTAAKLARWIRDERKQRVMLASVDAFRPAAVEQLEKLAEDLGIPFADGARAEPRGATASRAPDIAGLEVIQRAAAALEAARRQSIEVLIVDTAGRNAVDEAMMDEMQALHAGLKPTATLFVVDAMTGQDAARTAVPRAVAAHRGGADEGGW